MPDDFIPQIKPDEVVRIKEPAPVIEQNQFKRNTDQTPQIARQEIPLTQIKNKSRFKLGLSKRWSIVAIVLVIFLVVNIFLVLNIAIKAKKLVSDAKLLKNAFSQQDTGKIKIQLSQVDKSLKSLHSAYKLISYTKLIPFFGGYVKDGDRMLTSGKYGVEVATILISATEPYLDLIGFKGGVGSLSAEQTAADRIDFIVKAIPDVLPKIGDIEGKMKLIKTQLDGINPKRYPVKFAGKEVRTNVESALDLFNQSYDFIVNGKPLLEQTPYLLGLESPRTYLVLFQNDKELRPTGGFMTAYSIMKVDKAKFEPVDSSDIYNLDAKYKPTIVAPEPIINHIKGPYTLNKNLRLRDMNWSPDFEDSMKLFLEEAGKVGVENIDGVIAVDTGVLVNLLNVLGEVGVSGFGNYSTKAVPECNCPQVIYELESFADIEGPVVWDPAGTGKIIYAPPNFDNRKKIIGPLMNSIMANTLGQPKEKLPLLFEAVFKSMSEKHLLFYMLNEKPQKAVRDFNIAGKIKDYQGDYLHINDSNLGGRKSNLYLTQEVDQEIKVAKDGSVEKTVTITYKNPEKQDGWLNSVLPNWVRMYVPKGSQLLSIDGLEEKQEPYEEFGKSVFAGFVEIRPQGVAKVTIKYKLPFKFKDKYNLFIQKQPGIDGPLYTIKVGKQDEELFLTTDKELKFAI